MTVLQDVLVAVVAGVPAERLAPTLGIDPGLAELALDHWVRRGVVTDAGTLGLGCATCPPQEQRPITCKGCPFG